MDDTARQNLKLKPWMLPSSNQKKEFWVVGRLVFPRDKGSAATPGSPVPEDSQGSRRSAPQGDHKLLGFPVIHGRQVIARRTDLEEPPRILSLDELAGHALEGLDYPTVLNALADLGPEGRVVLFFRNGKLLRWETFEDPRICKDVERGAVIHNLEQKPPDMSGWRTHEFSIDSKGCLGELCARCVRVCPENAIHLRGEGASSFCEIDPTACKGCFICWVECVRKSADCILIDGKVFDSELRSAHFGE